MKKRVLSVILSLCLLAGLWAVPAAASGEGAVTILYTNDVHTYIEEDLTYSMVAAYKDSLENALLVDAGDHIQGTAYGGMDSGETISRLMNAAGYDLATPGNHEFDYGMEGAMAAMERAEFPYVSCNFYHVADGVPGENVLESFRVLEAGGVRIAFVGISTPETFSVSAPVYFQNEAGEFIYGFAGGADGEALYAAVQKAIDEARKVADYVIALGHLGVDPSSGPWTSEAVIANTEGLDAFIDGHSHTAVESRPVADRAGNGVLLTQTGSYFAALGELTISRNGEISARLLAAGDLAGVVPDAGVKALEEAWVAEIDSRLGEKIAHTDIDFTIYEANGDRAVRESSTNMADFNADAYYWYMNEKEGLDCDVAIVNGGGVRAAISAGEWTYNSCKSVNPFGNVLCMVELTGQELLDALEFGARLVGEGECGGLLHPAGLTYEVNPAIPSSVELDGNGSWAAGPETYRVSNVQVYDRDSGRWLPLEPDRFYTVAGSNFTIRNRGDGFEMLGGAVLVKDYIVEDYLALAEYALAFRDADSDGFGELSSDNSPLAAWEGYLLDYESSTGAGRIGLSANGGQGPAVEAAAFTYTVVPGDCLWTISRQIYGSGFRWEELYRANRDILRDPDRIFPGQVLTIPA